MDESQFRRRSEVLPDEENGFGSMLKRHATNVEARYSSPDVSSQLDDGASLKTKRSRLRSLSETFGGLLGSKDKERRKGKGRDDEGGGAGNGAARV